VYQAGILPLSLEVKTAAGTLFATVPAHAASNPAIDPRFIQACPLPLRSIPTYMLDVTPPLQHRQ
jgi:hypothetical protein